MATPLADVVNQAITEPVVAVPISSGAAAPLPAVDSDAVEYFMTLFEHYRYTEEQLAKQAESKNKEKAAGALAAMAARGRAVLNRFFGKKVAAGEAEDVQTMVETALGAAEAAKPTVAAKLQAAANDVLASATGALSRFWTWATKNAANGGPGIKELPGKAAAAFVALWGIIKCAVFRVRNWKPDLEFLTKMDRIGIIDARYGRVALPGALSRPGALPRLNTNTKRFFLVDRYKEYKTDELVQALRDFSARYSLSRPTEKEVKKLLEKKMHERANWRFVKNRYGSVTPLISAENWERIRSGKTTFQQVLAKKSKGGPNRVGRLNARYSFASRPKAKAEAETPGKKQGSVERLETLGERYSLAQRTPGASPARQNSRPNIMNNQAIQAAMAELMTARPELAAMQNLIRAKARAKGEIGLIKAYLNSLKNPTVNQLKNLYGLRFNRTTRLSELLAMTRNASRWPQALKNNFDKTLREELYKRAESIRSSNLNYSSIAEIVRAINAAPSAQNVAGATTWTNALKREINRLGSSGNRLRINENKLARIAGAVGRVSKLTSLSNSIRNAQGRIARLRRNENARRRNRGLPPLPAARYYPENVRSRNYRYYPENVRPRSYGNMRPGFVPEPNRPQPGVVPVPPPLQPFPAIPANNRPPPMPSMRPENLLPPTEAAAVTNAGGVNKALNLVENAGGPANVAKTANILRNVGGNPNAAVAAGANAKNVKIVLQLGGANNALKVASAVPKLKKRRRSKPKKTKKPAAPRVKEIKKLIKFLGTKEELVKKLPNPENKEKKLTKDQVVAKITTHLLRKGKK